MTSVAYEDFLAAKVAQAPTLGFQVGADELSPKLKPHQAEIVRWMVAGGRRACFAAFGLGKTVIQLEAGRVTRARAGGRALWVTPLGVRQEFRRDAVDLLGWSEPPKFIRTTAEASDPEGLYLTNYESVREGKIDPHAFSVVSLDEAACLRAFGGSKTFREFMRLFAGDDRSGARTRGVPYRYVATATPSPNEYIELLCYSAYLDVLDVSAAKTRFFKRDSTKADHLTLHAHKEREFWLWLASWAVFVTKPSDIDPSFSDEGYELPPLDVRWHEIPTNHTNAGADNSGQARLYKNAALGVVEASREKRDSMPARVAKMLELRAEDPQAHRVIWHDLEDERAAIEASAPGVVTVYGSQDLDLRERAVLDFSDGKIQEIAGKPVMLGAGVNWQRHCAWAIYLGIGFKFADWIQSVHRLRRYLQTRTVRLDLIYTEAEREVRLSLETKWRQHDEMVAQMAALIREYGLARIGSASTRSLGVVRREASGRSYRLVNADAIEESRSIESDSVHLVISSIPFSTQYEYSNSYNDLGHTNDSDHFFEHLGYLTPELLRVLQPGRVAAIHVKDRIVPSGLSGLGFQTVSPFSDHTIAHFTKNGFAFLGRKTIVTDVVRENNQTYRLGWSEQCKDGSRMGFGMPEYLLLFRKPQTDRTRGYADVPVVKTKEKYSRSRWQVDAHGFARSNGNRPITPADLEGLAHDDIFRLYRKYSLTSVYDFEHHVGMAEALERCRHCEHIHTGDKRCGQCDCTRNGGLLPTTFMLLQPQSWHPDVWSDIARMRTMNTLQAQAGREMHLCPIQFDIVDRLIEQFSMEGELVFDPFAGLATVPYCAVKKGRRGLGVELNTRYFADGAAYCAAAERALGMPSLLDVLDAERPAEASA